MEINYEECYEFIIDWFNKFNGLHINSIDEIKDGKIILQIFNKLFDDERCKKFADQRKNFELIEEILDNKLRRRTNELVDYENFLFNMDTQRDKINLCLLVIAVDVLNHKTVSFTGRKHILLKRFMSPITLELEPNYNYKMTQSCFIDEYVKFINEDNIETLNNSIYESRIDESSFKNYEDNDKENSLKRETNNTFNHINSSSIVYNNNFVTIKEHDNLLQKYNALQRNVETMCNEMEEERLVHEQTDEKYKMLSGQMDKLKSERIHQNDQLKYLTEQHLHCENLINELNNEKNKLNIKLSQFDGDKLDEIKQLKLYITDLSNDITSQKKQLDNKDNEISAIEKANLDVKKENYNLKFKCESLENEISELKEYIDLKKTNTKHNDISFDDFIDGENMNDILENDEIQRKIDEFQSMYIDSINTSISFDNKETKTSQLNSSDLYIRNVIKEIETEDELIKEVNRYIINCNYEINEKVELLDRIVTIFNVEPSTVHNECRKKLLQLAKCCKKYSNRNKENNLSKEKLSKAFDKLTNQYEILNNKYIKLKDKYFEIENKESRLITQLNLENKSLIVKINKCEDREIKLVEQLNSTKDQSRMYYDNVLSFTNFDKSIDSEFKSTSHLSNHPNRNTIKNTDSMFKVPTSGSILSKSIKLNRNNESTDNNPLKLKPYKSKNLDDLDDYIDYRGMDNSSIAAGSSCASIESESSSKNIKHQVRVSCLKDIQSNSNRTETSRNSAFRNRNSKLTNSRKTIDVVNSANMNLTGPHSISNRSGVNRKNIDINNKESNPMAHIKNKSRETKDKFRYENENEIKDRSACIEKMRKVSKKSQVINKRNTTIGTTSNQSYKMPRVRSYLLEERRTVKEPDNAHLKENPIDQESDYIIFKEVDDHRNYT